MNFHLLLKNYRMYTQKFGIILCLICVILWSLIPVVAKIGQINMDHHSFLFWSSLTSFLTLFFLVLLKNNPKIIINSIKSLKEGVYLIFLGLLGTYIYYLLLYYGYKTANGIEVLILQYTWPIFMVFFSIIFFQENISKRKLLGLIIGFLGVFIALTKGNFFHPDLIHVNTISMFLVILGSMCFALFSVLSKNLKKDALVLNTFYFFIATIASFLSMNAFYQVKLPPQNAIISILINGCLVNGVSYVIWIEGLKRIDTYIAASIVFLTPILAALYLIIFFKEPFSFIYILSLGLVIFSGLLCRI